jgi:hypothetical protein
LTGQHGEIAQQGALPKTGRRPKAVKRWRVGRTESHLQHLQAEVKRHTKQPIPESANV